MKKAIEHIWSQPLYLTLKQYRLVAISAIIFSGWFMLEVWETYKEHIGKLSEYELLALFGFLATMAATFKWSVDNIKDKHEE